MDRFSKFFHQLIREKILYVQITNIFTSPVIYTLLHYLVKFENTNMLLIHVERDNDRLPQNESEVATGEIEKTSRKGSFPDSRRF